MTARTSVPRLLLATSYLQPPPPAQLQTVYLPLRFPKFMSVHQPMHRAVEFAKKHPDCRLLVTVESHMQAQSGHLQVADGRFVPLDEVRALCGGFDVR